MHAKLQFRSRWTNDVLAEHEHAVGQYFRSFNINM